MSNPISRTGRVQSWIDDPEGRLPVSCTVFNVLDSMEGDDGIEASWRFASHALRNGAGVAIHLSEIRPKEQNGKGLVASGPVSFGQIYSTLNATLRRGGKYKNGAIVLHLDANHADVDEFITTPRELLPWAKRCVNITQEWWDNMDAITRQKLIKGIKAGDIWLNKVKYNTRGERIRGNVCLEVYLPSRGTCLLQHVNLGACEFGRIKDAFVDGMTELCELHGKTGVGETGEYLDPSVDRQVGLGVLGLANLLRRAGVTYEDFGHALDSFNSMGRVVNTAAGELVKQMADGIQAAARVANTNKMDRAFAIAPTASCSYRSQDLDGYTCAPKKLPTDCTHGRP